MIMRKWSIFLLLLLLSLAGCLLWRDNFRFAVASQVDLTIVHMTDLHLSKVGHVEETPWTHKISIGGYRLHQPCTARSIQLMERAVDVIEKQVKPDVVVITGDIRNNFV